MIDLLFLLEKPIYLRNMVIDGESMKEIVKEAFSILFAIISIYIFLVFILSL